MNVPSPRTCILTAVVLLVGAPTLSTCTPDSEAATRSRLDTASTAGASDTSPVADPLPADAAEDDVPIHERIDRPSLAACGGCHGEVYDEWAESLHHEAWTNENIQRATRQFRRAACRACHSPMPVLEQDPSERPEYRRVHQTDGVHCLSCHGISGGVAAARTIPDAPCNPRYEPRLLRAESCEPCHEPTHHAFEEYRVSDAHALGIRCVDCHMPILDRGDRPGRSHGPHGGFQPAFVRKAITQTIRAVPASNDLPAHVEVSLANRCGHKFPGEIPSRSFVVRVRFGDREPEYTTLRKPFRGEDREDDRLTPDERRVLRFPFPDGEDEAVVDLLFKPLPLTADAAAHDLGHWAGSRPATPVNDR